MKKIIILGAGFVGRAIAIDLSKEYDVTSADINTGSLQLLSGKHNINTITLDVTDKTRLKSTVKDFNMVISAVPGAIGFETMRALIEIGKNLIDISFMPEDPIVLDHTAKSMGVTVITDCGVAPGLPNFIIGYHNQNMKIMRAEYYVGGLPKEKTQPFEYKAPFSPADVIEEYIRPARFISDGRVVTEPAMSDPELIDFGRAGVLEAFNTDGLRSLVRTMSHIPNLKEKTLRYPGHIKLIKALIQAGFFDKESLRIGRNKVRPLDVTIKLLVDNWKLNDGDEEFTVLKVIIEGYSGAVRKEIIYELYDEYDRQTGLSSMSRTTGFTASAVADMVLEGLFTATGVFPPEEAGKTPGCFNHILSYLKERKIEPIKTEKEL